MGLITENNEQYYAGAQRFLSTGVATQVYTTTFNTDLVFGSNDPANVDYALNNFKLYTAAPGSVTFTEYTAAYAVANNVIDITATLAANTTNIGALNVNPLAANTTVVVQLKMLDGGAYGNRDAFGTTVEKNYDSYSYIKLNDIINNFQVAYIGVGKLISSVKRTDVIFHAKRGLQEFSYDTLRSIHSQELTIPPSLGVIIPQDYVNYVSVSWIDQLGVKRPIYPANNLTTNPHNMPLQDNKGIPTQDNFSENIEGTSITEERWAAANDKLINGEANIGNDLFAYGYGWEEFGGRGFGYGQLYGLDPQYSQRNGWFSINNREGKMSFSSNLAGKLIVLEYISDGLSYDLETKVPKMAEEALYAYISYAMLSTRANQPEYVIRRLRQEKSSKLRNAKIRLSNIKLDEIVQVMRGKSKWIKS